MSTIKLRRDTTVNWLSENPILALGEPGWDTDLKKLKIGDGATAWGQLPLASGGQGPVGPLGVIGDQGALQEEPISFGSVGAITAGSLVSLDGPKRVRATSNSVTTGINRVKPIDKCFENLISALNATKQVVCVEYDEPSDCLVIVVLSLYKLYVVLGVVNLDGTLSFSAPSEATATNGTLADKLLSLGAGKYCLVFGYKLKAFSVDNRTTVSHGAALDFGSWSITKATYLGSGKILVFNGGIGPYTQTLTTQFKVATLTGLVLSSADTSITQSTEISNSYPHGGALMQGTLLWSESQQRLVIRRYDSLAAEHGGHHIFDTYVWDGNLTFTLEGSIPVDVDLLYGAQSSGEMIEYAPGKVLMATAEGSMALLSITGGTPKTLAITGTRSRNEPGSPIPVGTIGYGYGLKKADPDGRIFFFDGTTSTGQISYKAVSVLTVVDNTSIGAAGGVFEFQSSEKTYLGDVMGPPPIPCLTPHGVFAFLSDWESYEILYAKVLLANTSTDNNVAEWLGIAAESHAGPTGNIKVNLLGSAATVPGPLTTLDTYYVSDTGTLVNTPTRNGKIGVAISPTEIYLNYAGKDDHEVIPLLVDTFQGAFVMPRTLDFNAVSGNPGWIGADGQDLTILPLEVGGGLRRWTAGPIEPNGPPPPFADGSGLAIDLGSDIDAFTAEFVLTIHNQPLIGTFYLDLYVGNNGAAGLWTGDFIEFTAGGSYPVGYMTTYGFDPVTNLPIQPAPTSAAAYTVGDSTEHTYKFVYTKNGYKRLYFDGALLFEAAWFGQSWGAVADGGTFLQIDIWPGDAGVKAQDVYVLMKSVKISQGVA